MTDDGREMSRRAESRSGAARWRRPGPQRKNDEGSSGVREVL